MAEKLLKKQVSIFFARPGEPGWDALLSPEEAKRCARLVRPEDRRLCVLSKGLCRRALAFSAGVSPRELGFAKAEGGKPEICAPAEAAGLCFSVTNTEGLAMTAAGRVPALGIDAEPRSRRVEEKAVSRYFHPEEKQALSLLAGDEAGKLLLGLWTLKEAFAKALGKGLALSLAKTCFTISPQGRVEAAFDPELREDPAAWRFFLFSPTPEHRAALAVKSVQVPEIKLFRLRHPAAEPEPVTFRK